MENEPPFVDEGRSSRRGRIMGKLFGKEKKSQESSAATLDAFLHSSADKLEVTHAPPPPPPSSLPKLAKLDTTISRYPQALAVNQQAQQNRPMAPGRMESKSPRISPRPNKKGLIVRFADSYPDIIGEGGDESEIPTIEIGRNRRARPPPPPVHRSPRLNSAAPVGGPPGPPVPLGPPGGPDGVDEDFRPKPLSRTQTGYSSIYEPETEERSASSLMPPSATNPRSGNANTLVPGRAASARYLETSGRRDDQRRSFIEIHQAQMREAEGKAFALAARTASSASQRDWEEGARPPATYADDSPDSSRQYPSSPEIQIKQPAMNYSPAGSITSNTSSAYPGSNPSQTSLPIRQPSTASHHGPPPGPPPSMAARSASIRLNDAVDQAGEDALAAFVMGTKHLFELFRLHAETIRPLSTCAPKDCARAALWWFLKGRMGLEAAVRDRPTTPKSQMQNELDRQQAYSNLAKGYWLCQEAIPEITAGQRLPPDAEVAGASQTLVSALRKLSQSMKRNGFLPPEEPFLPQTIDKSIWLEYPALSQDLNALLSGNWASGLTAMQHPMSTLQLLDAFPLGDTSENFSYGRVMADVFLMEQGRESQRLFLPCILSMVRPQKSTGLVFVIASQNGCVQLAIQDNKNAGPVWEDLRWQNNTCAVEVRLPRGFLLVAQLNQNDYRMLWNMYDFGSKVQATLHPRSDELVVFRNNLRSFQYMDADPQSRLFPKEAVSQCDVALFEKIYKENGPAGPRSWHCGFRIAVVTGPRTRTLSGVQHSFPPPLPVQFGFFRAEGEAPALSVKFVNGRQKGRMNLVFSDEKERLKFHSLLTGTALNHDERVFSESPLKSFMVAQSLREPTGIAPFSRIPWKAARIINDEFSSDRDLPPTVLADKLKVVLEYQNGTVADRVNVAPGELRMRLEVSNAKILRVLRQPQQDITMAVSEAQVPKELPANLADALQLLKANQTIRSYEFNNLKDLHDFQTALTGFEVIFDALAVTFAISRRRMVVPIHKKWEAGYTRIQVVKLEDKQLQLLAFFEDFQYGHCMNFVLKGTDVYETFQRGSKAGVKFVDAKFPLPRLPADKDADYDDMAFVCLDLPDLPGEHDDISIMFETETDRDLLCKCLPAPTKGSSRISSRLR
ncbi:hypothetical protein VFPPC_15590 [Pochonia chlamydosporia 170]|uniref:Uncharacterized protein n=1 Tax=Pochonia chlamydosporia 170 TaxID=1380566 RepID=A0A179FZC2_METCM|nr:hypothetical protein VFPPC_15590 [Pochonia chlamydosporia 170]OAQ70530.1 hypothetical protein VFPPC_15590 [Pochonia chlamydosporia 170]